MLWGRLVACGGLVGRQAGWKAGYKLPAPQATPICAR